MEKKKDYLLIYIVIIAVVAIFGWMWLKPQPVVYYGEIIAIDHQEEGIHFTLGPAVSPFPDYDVSLTANKSGMVGPKGLQLNVRAAPDGTRMQYVDLQAMFEALQPGDEIGFRYRDKQETMLHTIIFITPTP